MLRLNTGDPCPCCGQPIALTDPTALEMLTRICDMLDLPDLRKPVVPHLPPDGYLNPAPRLESLDGVRIGLTMTGRKR